MKSVTEEILTVLPQTQCEECGYKGCRPYAEAVNKGESIDLCAPGGMEVYEQIANITNREGDIDKVRSRYGPRELAVIDQAICIGCTKCINPCPTNAIVGYKKRNHFVISADCTGCGLCVSYCPVDCITMEEDGLSQQSVLSLANEYRALYEQKKGRESKPSLLKKSREDIQSSLKDILGGSLE